jgi:YmgG-like glycine-zipper protein
MLRAFLAGRTAPLGALLVSTLLSACADRGADQQALADSALARDLALVQSAATPQPIFRDTALTNAPAPRRERAPSREPVARPVARATREREVAATPRQRRQTLPVRQRETRRPARVAEAPPPRPDEPAAQPAPSAERSGGSGAGAIGAGTVLTASSNARVCSRSNLPGDRITATVNAPVRGTTGAEIPAGAKVVLEVVSVNAGDSSDEGQVVFRVNSVAIGDESYPASGGATASGRFERVAGPRNASSDRRKVIGGAIAGAILGQMMGKDTRSAVIGAAAGAAAGTAAAKMGDRGEACLAAGTSLRINLDEEMVLH